MTSLIARVSLLGVLLLMGARDGGCAADARDDGTCPALACATSCGSAGAKVDENGCDTCECNAPVVCAVDSDCAAGTVCDVVHFCELPPGCGPNVDCPPVCYGRCVAPPPASGCSSDADCAADELCALPSCVAPVCDAAGNCPDVPEGCGRGTCEARPSPSGCASDADCAPGAVCAASDCASAPCDGDDCPSVICLGACVPAPVPCDGAVDPAGHCRTTCDADSQCEEGQRCVPDPSDPCNRPDTECFARGRSYCAPADPPPPPASTCATDTECQNGERCLPDPTDPCNRPGVECFQMGRRTCQPVSCAPVACDVYCAYGHAVDASGCEICACNPAPSCACTEQYDPVCGVDGTTYSNRCFAACGQVEVAHDGACGGRCLTDADCGSADRCVGAHVPPPNTLPPVVEGDCRPIDWCEAVSDCTSLAPTTSCVGSWSCEANHCAYTCAVR